MTVATTRRMSLEEYLTYDDGSDRACLTPHLEELKAPKSNTLKLFRL
jgi:hypothetical protein